MLANGQSKMIKRFAIGPFLETRREMMPTEVPSSASKKTRRNFVAARTQVHKGLYRWAIPQGLSVEPYFRTLGDCVRRMVPSFLSSRSET